MIHWNIETQCPGLFDAFRCMMTPDWNVVELDCTIVVTDGNPRFDATLVGPREA